MTDKKTKARGFNGINEIKKNPWIFVVVVLVLILLVMLFYGSCSLSGNVISEEQAGENLVGYLSAVGYDGFEVTSTDDLGSMYLVNTTYNGKKIPFYVTKEGYLLGNSLTSIVPKPQSEPVDTGIPKSDKPEVELFVMSYCPYGTQAEKGIIPVVELLGDKIDFKLRFVDYAMHPSVGEVEENLREYCIQKEEPEKLIPYMRCFLEGDGVEEGGYIKNGNDFNSCLDEANVDMDKISACITQTDAEFEVTENLNDKSSWMNGNYPHFNVDKELNDRYGVGGSPTLVINGEKVQSSRSPAAYLSVICSAFNDAPEECSTELSSDSPSVYFGWDATSSGGSSGAQCG